MGVMSHGLGLTKEDGYLTLAGVRNGTISMGEFHQKMRKLIVEHAVQVEEIDIAKPF